MAVHQIEVVAVCFFKHIYYRQNSENNENYMQENIELSINFIARIVFVNSN